MNHMGPTTVKAGSLADESGMSLAELLGALRSHLKLLSFGPVVAGLVALGGSFLVAPTFTAGTTIIPSQQAQGSGTAAMAALGSLAALTGGVAVRSDQYVALMQSVTVSDRLIDEFGLMEVYGRKFRVDARKDLASNVRINLGKKDGLIRIEVDDTSPQRAADIANRYVDELRRVTAGLAMTEAQQRRVFFEQQLKQSRDRLVLAQQALQNSGFNGGALKAEPKTTAESYARLRSEVAAAEVRLQVTQGSLTDSSPEVRQQRATLAALRDQLALVERATDSVERGSDYMSRYREFKYQETLFDLNARQFELARVDEAREGALIQVVDEATVPEKKSRPRRAYWALGAFIAAEVLLVGWILLSANTAVGRKSFQTD